MALTSGLWMKISIVNQYLANYSLHKTLNMQIMVTFVQNKDKHDYTESTLQIQQLYNLTEINISCIFISCGDNLNTKHEKSPFNCTDKMYESVEHWVTSGHLYSLCELTEGWESLPDVCVQVDVNAFHLPLHIENPLCIGCGLTDHSTRRSGM